MRPLTGHELPFLRRASAMPIKMTLPSATQFPAISYKAGITDKAYRDHTALLWDIVEILKGELVLASPCEYLDENLVLAASSAASGTGTCRT